jgi:hypothetical protein
MLQHLSEERLAEGRQFGTLIAQYLMDGVLESLRRTRNDQTSLCEQAPDLIDHGSTLAHQNGTHPMDGLDIFLLDRLNADKAYRRPTCGLNDCLGVVAVVLVRLHERRHILRTY